MQKNCSFKIINCESNVKSKPRELSSKVVRKEVLFGKYKKAEGKFYQNTTVTCNIKRKKKKKIEK